MKLAVILTGGTIGSRKQENGWIAPDAKVPYEVMEQYQREFPVQASGIEFDCFQPYRILSENLSGKYLDMLIDRVRTCLSESRYDGILICHGTDTLQYTAAILGYVFSNSRIPILMVSSNFPLEDSRANGLDNFHYAVETVPKGLTGVLVVYRNSDGKTYVHRGTRLLAHETFEDNLYSIHHTYMGVYDNKGNWISASDKEPTEERVAYRGLTEQTDGIYWLRVCPGMVYPELKQTAKAVILESYHSGTLGINESLKSFSENARALAVPIYLVGAISDTDGYETMKSYKELGIQVLPNEAPIAVYCRLWLELGSD